MRNTIPLLLWGLGGVFWALSVLAEPGPIARTIVPGVEYLQEHQPEGPTSVHIVKVDLAQRELGVEVILANGRVLGRETVRDLVANRVKTQGRPVAAVNGDYFETGKAGDPRYQGTLEGLHIGQSELIHGPAGNVFWMDPAGRPHLTNGVGARFQITWPDGSRATFALNCSTTAHQSEVGTAPVVLYTPAFGDSTRTDTGRELVLAPAPGSAWLPLRVGVSYTGVVEVVSDRGNSAIPPGRMVVSVVTNRIQQLPSIKPGDRIGFTTTLEPDFRGIPQALGGGPILLLGGHAPAGGQDRQNRAPRTAIGFNSTHLFLVVVDGRQPRVSVGMSHGELADLMRRLGCTDALNLDGGGSSTLWLDGTVVNAPSDLLGERAIGNAVVITRKIEN